ncbi:hypothetical protein [Longitalea arenae]|uniref:hypothetical protein n=1 Tax=Longitalea arenae TaxID=2812558 RepID=UPI001966DD22|nr:hypothetical protein [Longitalea arenae]
MLSSKDVKIIYEMMLATPGMNDEVKLNLRVPRKTVPFLSKAIEIGLLIKADHEAAGLLQAADAASLEKLQDITSEILTSAGLVGNLSKNQHPGPQWQMTCVISFRGIKQ